MSEPLTFVCRKETCTGCGMCIRVCPFHAISRTFCRDTMSSVAVIDPALCKDCSLCRKVCPVLNPVPRKPTLKTYAGWLKDPAKAALSASGGIAWQLAEQTIRDGGVVYGAAYADNGVLHHARAERLEDAAPFRLSKYVQSRFDDCLPELKKDLDSGRKVLLTGTPCQIAAAYRFLKKDYPALVTADLICHGVPDQEVLASYIRNLLGDQSYSEVRFRNVHGFEFSVYARQKQLYRRTGMIDRYMAGFMYGYQYRKNCYSCTYACPERVADLTLGDFWGLKKEDLPRLPENRGLSLCMVHSERGAELLRRCGGELHLFERTEQEAVRGNNQLRAPYPAPAGRQALAAQFNGENVLELLKRDSRLSRICRKAYMRAPAVWLYHKLLDFRKARAMRKKN